MTPETVNGSCWGPAAPGSGSGSEPAEDGDDLAEDMEAVGGVDGLHVGVLGLQDDPSPHPEVAPFLERPEMRVDRARRVQPRRLPDLAHGGRVATALHRLEDVLEDVALALREVRGVHRRPPVVGQSGPAPSCPMPELPARASPDGTGANLAPARGPGKHL